MGVLETIALVVLVFTPIVAFLWARHRNEESDDDFAWDLEVELEDEDDEQEKN